MKRIIGCFMLSMFFLGMITSISIAAEQWWVGPVAVLIAILGTAFILTAVYLIVNKDAPQDTVEQNGHIAQQPQQETDGA